MSQPHNFYPLDGQRAPLQGKDVTEILDYMRRNGVHYLRMTWPAFTDLYLRRSETVANCAVRVHAELKSTDVMVAFGTHSVCFMLDANFAPAHFDKNGS